MWGRVGSLPAVHKHRDASARPHAPGRGFGPPRSGPQSPDSTWRCPRPRGGDREGHDLGREVRKWQAHFDALEGRGGVQGCRRRRPPPGRCVRSERRPGGWRTRARAPEEPGGLAFLGFCEAQRDVPEGRGRPVPRGPLASPRDTFSFPVPSAVSPEQRPRGPARMLGVGRRPERPAWAGTRAQCLSPLPPCGPGPVRPPCRSLS